MNCRTLVSILVALSLSGVGPVFADDRNDRGNSRHSRQDADSQRRDSDWRQPSRRSRDARPQEYRDNRGRSDFGRRDFDRRDYPRGAGPRQEIHRGQRLPVEYRNRHYVVDDWRGHRLSQPPRGYHWVQTGGDYVLVAIATGIILQLFLHN